MILRAPIIGPALVFFLLGAAGCSSADSETPGGSSEGVPLVELARSVPSVELSHVQGVAVDSRGRIFLSDAMSAEVVWLDSAGTLRGRIGRSGDGPGEFRRVGSIQILPGDTLLVFDPEAQRVTLFDPTTLTIAYSFRVAAEGLEWPALVYRLPHTGEYLTASDIVFTPSDSYEEEGQRRQIVRVVSMDGAVRRDSLLLLRPREFVVEREAHGINVFRRPFGRESLLRVGPHGHVFHAWTEVPEVFILSPGFEDTRMIGIDASLRPVSPRDVRSWAEQNAASPEAVRGWSPIHWPALRGFVVDDHNRVWVGLRSPFGAMVDWRPLDGEPRGPEIRFPENAEIMAVRHGRIYVQEIDELDVPAVVVYSVPAAFRPRSQ
jgi:hypothetical protein